MPRLAGALLLLVSAPLAAQGWTMEEAAKREQEALKRARILRIVGIPGTPASVAAALKELGAEVILEGTTSMHRKARAETEAAAGPDAGTSPPGDEQSAEEEVVDAEFSEVDDENKG
mgnify:CR=1 FL=1